MKVEIKTTRDGSNTLFVPELNEHYHSVHGALQEALHVFIKAGLQPALAQKQSVHVLEIGFGTGLNAILSLQQFLTGKGTVFYDSIEKYPLPPETIAALHFENFILNPELLAFFQKMHTVSWNKAVEIVPGFTLQKIEGDMETYRFEAEKYDLIYFDAFAPEKQPNLWTGEVFSRMAAALKPSGQLVSYCAKGSFKRSLKAAGFTVETLPGPPGKREMVRAIKN